MDDQKVPLSTAKGKNQTKKVQKKRVALAEKAPVDVSALFLLLS